jgi:hypothetical protein
MNETEWKSYLEELRQAQDPNKNGFNDYWAAQEVPDYQDVWNRNTSGLSNAQRKYFRDRVYNDFNRKNPDARDMWFGTIKEAEQQRYANLRTKQSATSYGNPAKVTTPVYNQETQKEINRLFPGWEPTATTSYEPTLDERGLRGAQQEIRDLSNPSRPQYADPWESTIKSYPFLQEWYSMSPDQRGSRKNWGSSSWSM